MPKADVRKKIPLVLQPIYETPCITRTLMNQQKEMYREDATDRTDRIR